MPRRPVTPKKVGALPVAGSDEQKQTNEIGMAIPLLAGCDIAGCDITGDALLTQRALASYIVQRQAHYHFTAKGNQPTLQRDIALAFEQRGVADFIQITPADHGRIETRRIWCSTALNAYLDFPHVGQVFLIERSRIEKKPALAPTRLRWASQAARRKRRHRNGYWKLTAVTGPSKAFITSSTGTTMRIAAASVRASARKISRACAVSRLASSNPSRNRINLSRQQCANSALTLVWSLTTCE